MNQNVRLHALNWYMNIIAVLRYAQANEQHVQLFCRKAQEYIQLSSMILTNYLVWASFALVYFLAENSGEKKSCISKDRLMPSTTIFWYLLWSSKALCCSMLGHILSSDL